VAWSGRYGDHPDGLSQKLPQERVA
jgi:hypothetical protein